MFLNVQSTPDDDDDDWWVISPILFHLPLAFSYQYKYSQVCTGWCDMVTVVVIFQFAELKGLVKSIIFCDSTTETSC